MSRWYSDISRDQWRSLVAAQLGWMLDAMDIMLYAFALSAIRDEFGLSSAGAGALASATLVASALGGILFGFLADRIGRAKALVYSILTYSLFTALTATAGSVPELLFWRALVGIGLGGEWSAGSVLVSEVWPPEHRGKAIGIMQAGWAVGYILAALMSALILPTYGWRPLFVAGILPALLTTWIRRNVKEPEIWSSGRSAATPGVWSVFGELLGPRLFRRTLIATLTCTSVLFAYWGLFTWIPTFLSTPFSEGGAGLTIVKSSGWIIPMQIGAFFGYTLFGFFADRAGRKSVFIGFLLAASVLVPIYGQVARSEFMLLILGPFVGFFGHGYFSVFGSMLAELFPTAIRGAAQGMTYNVGRAVSAVAPYSIGLLADTYGIGAALTMTSAFFLAGAGLILLLPETKGRRIEENY